MKTLISLMVLLMVVLLAAGPVAAGSQMRAVAGGPGLSWPAGSKVTYSFQAGTIAPNNDNQLVRGAVKGALATLMNSMPQQGGKPMVQFVEASSTTNITRIASDCVNVITFTDRDDALQSSIVAQATVWSSPVDQSNVLLCGKTVSMKAGEIYEVDMNFNTGLAFTTNLIANNVNDIQSVATHEGGHWLGVDHTGITSAVMSPFGDMGGFPVRALHNDDIATIASIYAPGGPSINGKVADGSGAAVKGAHVVATHSSTGLTTAATLSDANGNYRIYGLTAGQYYRAFAEPLDGPVNLWNMPPGWQDGKNNFPMTWANGGDAITATGAGTTVNITLGSGSSASNLQALGWVQPTGSTIFGGFPISLPRGTKSTIVMQGSGITKDTTLPTSSNPNIKVTLNSQIAFSDSSLKVADLTIPADAPIGSTDIMIAGSAFTGGIVVTTNPVVGTQGVTEGAMFNQGTVAPYFAPGSMITVWGTDLAAPGTRAHGNDVPLPTELAGMAIQISGSGGPTFLAPIFDVIDTMQGYFQINAILPYELTASQIANGVDVTVRTGVNSQSAPIHIAVASSAPRIFMDLNRLPTRKVGIIQKLLPPNYTSPVLIDDQTPLSAGDVLVIYCTGLGMPSGTTVPSGTANPAAPIFTVDPVTVTIGNKAVSALYNGLTPNFVGLYQVNIQLPQGVSTGPQPLVVSTKAGTSNVANILIQ